MLVIFAFFIGLMFGGWTCELDVKRKIRKGLLPVIVDEEVTWVPPEQASDGYHTFEELYTYRKLYNAALFNEWAQKKLYNVHKSKKHFDGSDCFDGNWFIVVADLPTGQISNHYRIEDWDLFAIPEVPQSTTPYDGHTPADVASRLREFLRNELH